MDATILAGPLGVGIGEGTRVAVRVGLGILVGVGVFVGRGVGEGVGVTVGVGVRVAVAVGVGVSVGDGATNWKISGDRVPDVEVVCRIKAPPAQTQQTSALTAMMTITTTSSIRTERLMSTSGHSFLPSRLDRCSDNAAIPV